MDRFKLDDMEDEFDTVEPMRASSFDMSFTLSSSRVAAAAADDDDADGDSHHHNSNRSNRSNHNDSDSGENDSDERWTTTNWRPAHRTMLDDPSNHHNNNSNATDDQSSLHVSQRRKRSSPHEQQSAQDAEASGKSSTIAQKLEEKAHETIALASLCGKVPWRLAKRNQDVHIYRPASLPESEQSKLYFRISCEVKANLHTILEYLTPRDTKSYVDIEAQVFPGLLHASVIKRMELPEHSSASAALPEPLYKDTTSTDDASAATAATATGGGSGADTFPRLQVKWHASRFAGRFVKPVDFFFVEYANVDTLADGRKRGFGYVRSVESFKGDELATRLHSDDVAIPPSVAKCKRAVINKGVYLVSPSGDAPGTYEVTFMLVIDFQQQFPSSVGAKIVQSFTDRLMGIRELLFNTLFQPVSLVPKELWKPARGNKCAVCYASFSFVKPMHHCRACGEAVCGQCSRKWVVQPGQQQKETLKRLCTSCSLQARSYLMGGEAIAPTHHSPAASDDARRTLSSSRSVDSTLRMTSSSASVRPSARMLLHDPMPMCDVKVASAVSADVNHFNAVSTTFYTLCESLGGVAPHFMMVAYSKEYDGHAVYEALAHCAPDTLFMGGTSSAGVFSERGSVSKGPGLALWGIYDPEGSYSVLNADLAVENPRDAARRCVLESMAMLCMEPEECPDFVWMSVRTGSEELLVKGVNDAVDCAVTVVGGSSTRNHIGASTIPATQICSEGSTVGCVTTHGACFAICSPSVEVSHALFTCYEPKDKVLAVTKATGRELAALGHKPAFSALNDACHGMLYEFLNRPERFNAETHTLPLFYPVARERPAPKPPLLTSKLPTYQHHVLQPEHAGKDLVLHLGADAQLGERLRVMAIEPERVKEKINGGYREALRAMQPALDASDVIGCLTSVGLCYTKIVQGELKSVSEATSRMFPNAAVLGSVSHGQQGVFHGASDAIHANGMVSSLLLTNRKKVPRGAPLPPLGLRRISTF